MKNVATLSAAAAVVSILTGCGHDHSDSSTPPPTNTAVFVTTGDLLTKYAKQPSETAEPVQVNDGAFTITATNDVSEPVGIN